MTVVRSSVVIAAPPERVWAVVMDPQRLGEWVTIHRALRDVTPEATRAVIEREIPGVAEVMRAEGRKATPLAALSRAVAGVRGRTAIINLPGSPKGAVESLDAIVNLIPHIVDLLEGRTGHADVPH